MLEAENCGANIAKQWNSQLDGNTRYTHRLLDGQIRELHEPFEVLGTKVVYPSAFGIASEDINCRCVIHQRARWALDEKELETLKHRAKKHGLQIGDKEYFEQVKVKDFKDFKNKYLIAAKKMAKTVENTGGSSKIYTKHLNRKIGKDNTVINPMDKAKYTKMKSNLEQQGINVIQAKGDDLTYLKTLGAEATYGNGYIMHIGETPSASGLYEEIIHATQAKIYGEFTTSDALELYAREVAANRMLLKHGKAYGFDEIDFEDIELNLATWEAKFEKIAGVLYDESDYSREI